MKESNIYFATNTFNYGSEYLGPTVNKFHESKGNIAFFRQVMDYDALMKLKWSPRMHGGLNSNYYTAHISQIRVLDPNFSSVMLGRRKIDPEIQRENEIHDAEYGYPQKNDFYPLLEEVVLDSREMSYADELLGKWIRTDQGLESSPADTFGLYLKQKAETDTSDRTVKPEDAGFEEIEDTDPYYYIYREAAGKEKKALGNQEKTKLYEEVYGSIFKAFSEVSQEEIIQAPLRQWSFVNAGPGTGKTYTLMKKITYMIEHLEQRPEEILVLCFTNAAVNEIKARIQKYAAEEGDRSFINVDVRTFHSFSWLLISQANENFYDRPNYKYTDLAKLDYDQSIRKAAEIIREFGDEIFDKNTHLIVDEIQDLTNERAYLVMAMIRECMKNGAGVTILGDFCQAIYDYSNEDTLFPMKSAQFYKRMFSEFYGRGKFYKLEKNHRQSDRLIEATAPLRTAILDDKTEKVREAAARLERKVPSLVTKQLTVAISGAELKQMTDEGTVCLLCRTNAQVLAASTNLRKRGIRHIVNAYDEFEYIAGWVGRVFGLFTKEMVAFGEFSRLAKNGRADISPEAIWERLQDLIGSVNNVLRIPDILRSIAQSKVDDPIFRNVPRGKLIVSNIHKSKGREYDTVVVEKNFVNMLVRGPERVKGIPAAQRREETQERRMKYMEEAKTLYVAVTRPRAKLYFDHLATADVSIKRIKTGRKRWARGDGSNLAKIEIRALSDADMDSYHTVDIQEYIIGNIAEGDEIKLLLDTDSQSISYNIVHTSANGDRVIGRTSEDFVEDVDAVISPYGSPWPRRITDLYVSGIYSKISEDFREVWCWVDFCGLGMAHTDVY